MAVEAERDPPEVPADVVGQVAAVLKFIHSLGPTEMILSDDEAAALAKAATGVARYYVKLTVNNKGSAWLALIIVCGSIYVPRLRMIAERNRAKKSPAAAPSEATPDRSEYEGGVVPLFQMPES